MMEKYNKISQVTVGADEAQTGWLRRPAGSRCLFVRAGSSNGADHSVFLCNSQREPLCAGKGRDSVIYQADPVGN